MVRLHEMWRKQYHVRRYMEFLTKEELEQRAKDVFNNLIVITGDVKIGLHPMHEEGANWMELWTHVQEEFEIRFGPYPSGFDNGFMKNVRIPRPTSPLADKAVRVAKQRRLQPGCCLIKYGKSQILRDAYETGAIRIRPADAYGDPSLNPAVHDNELAISLNALPSETTLTVLDQTTLRPTGTIRPIGNVTITSKAFTNYYVYCMSATLDPRLFIDFDYDACLVITNPKAFLEKLFAAFDQACPGWHGEAATVTYIDPLVTRTSRPDVFRSKHFRYWYQREFRVTWLPPVDTNTLKPLDLSLGELSSCCELVELNDA